MTIVVLVRQLPTIGSSRLCPSDGFIAACQAAIIASGSGALFRDAFFFDFVAIARRGFDALALFAARFAGFFAAFFFAIVSPWLLSSGACSTGRV
jgi:hypothetical protein